MNKTPENLLQNTRNYRMRNRDRLLARRKELYQLDIERLREYRRDWYMKNRIHSKEYKKIWRDNPEVIQKTKLYNKEYRATHREEIKKQTKLCWAKWRNTPSGRASIKASFNKRRQLSKGLTKATVQLVYEDNIKYYGTLTCYLCFKPIPFGKDHLEHKTPLSRGGDNRYHNLAVACQDCNLKKSNRLVIEYLSNQEEANRKV